MFPFINNRSRRTGATLGFTFARAAVSYWGSVFPRVCVHIARWRRRARRIPDAELRRLALAALAKRTNIEGAAAFAAFVPRRQRAAATLAMAAFQASYNLLDILGEQPAADPVADGRLLHEGLLYALDEHARARDWYELHTLREDGGYLQELLDECRAALARLPHFQTVAAGAQAAAARIVAFQSLNLSETQGDHAGLRQWSEDATPAGSGLQWWETAGAAGSSLGVHVLIARAAEPQAPDEREIAALDGAYFPWIGALHSLLDNVVDSHEDAAAGHRSLTGYYDSPAQAAQRLGWLARQSADAAAELPGSARHLTVLAGMIGSYVSAPETQQPATRALADEVLAGTGSLARPTMLVFKLRRLVSR